MNEKDLRIEYKEISGYDWEDENGANYDYVYFLERLVIHLRKGDINEF